MAKIVNVERALEENFWSDDQFYMVRCPKCKKENWAPFVAKGQCAWCGYEVKRGNNK